MTSKSNHNHNSGDHSFMADDYMNPEQLETFKNTLLTQKQSLEEQIERSMQDLKVHEKVADPADAASQNEDLILNLNKQEEAKFQLQKIFRSLSLIEENEYGYCDACGEEIGLKRLEARPTSCKCIDCANLEEIKNKNTYHRPMHVA